MFSTTRRVEFHDTDAAGIMHFSRYFTLMEEAEHELLRSLGTSVVGYDEEGKISWPRVSAKCDFRNSVQFEDELEIMVQVARVGRSSVTFAFRFRVGEREVAEGELTADCCRFPVCEPPRSIPLHEPLAGKLRALAAG